MVFLHIKSLPNLLFGVLCLPGDQSHPFAQPTINPLACCICWAGLLGRVVFPPWNEGPNFGSYKTIALIRHAFMGKVMSVLFNMLSTLVITFLPRSKCLLISWLQSPSTVILEPKKMKSVTVSTVSPSISHEVMGPDAMIYYLKLTFVSPSSSLVASIALIIS